eukprot:14284275-Alexandrium_andersonii.AAC.1
MPNEYLADGGALRAPQSRTSKWLVQVASGIVKHDCVSCRWRCVECTMVTALRVACLGCFWPR